MPNNSLNEILLRNRSALRRLNLSCYEETTNLLRKGSQMLTGRTEGDQKIFRFRPRLIDEYFSLLIRLDY